MAINGQVDQGSAYVFAAGSGWSDMTQVAKLTASDGAADDNFGGHVAINGDTIIVGSSHDDIGPNSDQGSAYVFVKPGGGWSDMTQTAKLTAGDAPPLTFSALR
ncbi:MAG: FG-GAP repeat protein [Anaerolineae bacterium]